MQEITTEKVLITGITSEAKRNILFQSAVHWAEEGCKVLYITRSQFHSIPTTGHGPSIPSAEVLTKIRIVYPENLDELLKFIADIVTFRDAAPKVILMEGLNDYFINGDHRESDHGFARVCATLCHVASSCAAHCDQIVYLLVTADIIVNRLPPVVTSMFDSVWCFCSTTDTLTKILPVKSPTSQLSLAYRSGDESYVLRTACQLFAKTLS